MRTLNLGILAHVDAGKTSLTERLLHAAGVIDAIGSVDDGSTQTDSLALERQRGITIKSAVVSFTIGDTTVNLIDTPGHPDFIAEVERVLAVLDGAVLVVSAVEGVQAQTRVLMRTLRRLRIPTLIFVNKIDRAGAGHERVLTELAERLASGIVPMGTPTGISTREAGWTPFAGFTGSQVEVLAEHDDAVLAAFVDDAPLSPERLDTALVAQTALAQAHPVFFGSAITGAGVDSLTGGIARLLPATAGDADAPVAGTVFKVERGPAGEKIAYVRLFAGTVRVRDRLRFGKVTAIGVFANGGAHWRDSVAAGEIAKVWGLADVRIGDQIGESVTSAEHYFAPPTLETIVVPVSAAEKGALHVALAQLAEQDPLINLRLDEIRQEISVSLYGEVQKEVIEATLANDYGLEVTFRETTTICIERVSGSGSAVELIDKEPNPFLATVGLRVDTAPVGSGVSFRLEVELGSMPYSFFTAVEETVRKTLRQGLRGWEVTDCVVTLTHNGYWPRQSHAHQGFSKSMSSTAGDFRNLTPLVLLCALQRAGTVVHEPMHRFDLEIPADTLGPVTPVLGRLGAVPDPPVPRGSTYMLTGEIPVAQVHTLTRLLPGLTRGEGVLESAFERYQEVRGAPPSRPRTDNNPLNRREYLLKVVRRVGSRGAGG